MLNWLLAMFLLSIFYIGRTQVSWNKLKMQREPELCLFWVRWMGGSRNAGGVAVQRRPSAAVDRFWQAREEEVVGSHHPWEEPGGGGALASQKVATTPLLPDPAIVVGPRSYPIFPVSMEVAMDSHNVKWTEEKLFRVAGWLPP